MIEHYSAGPFHFSISAPPALSSRLHDPFTDLLSTEAGPDGEGFVVDGPFGHPPQVELVLGGDRRTRPAGFAQAALVSRLNLRLLDSDPERLHVHAAAVGLGEVGVVLAARSGTGKSTTTAALVLDGWSYLSDESVALSAGSSLLTGVPKPLSLTPNAIALLSDKYPLARFGPPDAVAGPAIHKSLWSASGLGGEVRETIGCGVVAVLERPVDDVRDPHATPLSAAEATVRLLELTQDFERFGPDGLETLATLCAQSQCIRLSLGDLAQTTQLLRDIAERHTPPPEHELEIINFRDTQTVFVQSEAVVMNYATNTAISLPAETSELWRTELGANSTHSKVAAGLRDLGILDHTDGNRSRT